jgi:hypothetical protein
MSSGNILDPLLEKLARFAGCGELKTNKERDLAIYRMEM